MNMSVSKRFAIMLSLALPLLLLAAFLPTPFISVIFWLYNIGMIILLVIDILISPAAGQMQVKREEEYKLSHQAKNRIGFTIYNPSPYLINVEARDTVSDRHFKISKAELKHAIAPDEEKAFSYYVTPSKRGAFTFPQIHLKMLGVFGLIVKYHVFELPMEFKVYPKLQDLQRFRIMTQKNRLLPIGDKAIKVFGTGTEFESLRTYVEGDDYRKINWPVSAREMRLIVNDYQSEKNQPVFVMLDSGRPMSYSVKGYKKLDYAINASLILSDIVNQKGDQSGLLVFDRDVQNLIMPGKGEGHRNTLMEALYHIEETRDTSNYGEAFRSLCRRQKRRSLVFIFTDFETFEEAEELCVHMSYLKRRHTPIVVFMKNEGLEALAQDKDSYVKEVAENFAYERKQLFRRLRSMGIATVETAAESFSVTAVNQYLRVRNM